MRKAAAAANPTVAAVDPVAAIFGVAVPAAPLTVIVWVQLLAVLTPLALSVTSAVAWNVPAVAKV